MPTGDWFGLKGLSQAIGNAVQGGVAQAQGQVDDYLQLQSSPIWKTATTSTTTTGNSISIQPGYQYQQQSPFQTSFIPTITTIQIGSETLSEDDIKRIKIMAGLKPNVPLPPPPDPDKSIASESLQEVVDKEVAKLKMASVI